MQHDRGLVAEFDAPAALGLVSDHDRLRVIAAVVLGAATVEEIVERSGLESVAARRALARLISRGVVERRDSPPAYRVREEELRRAAGAGAAPRATTEHDPSLPEEQRKVLRAFMPDGKRLASIPASHTKRVVILDYIARRFDPGRTYPEKQVNAMLAEVHDDFATLRRGLVDEEFLERRDGFYWRAGGTFDVD